MTATVARLTVGMPLHNNARTLRRALDSLAAQTVRDIRVVMSDDLSTDETAALAAAFAERDPRFELHRQERNLNYGNFRYVLSAATSPYFMFAAGDDWWEPTYAERCIEMLERTPNAVCAVSQVHFDTDEHFEPWVAGTEPLVGSVVDNIRQFLSTRSANSRLFGVFPTPIAQEAFPATDHHAFDWTFSATTLLDGWHVEVPEVLMHREKTPSERYVEYVRRDARRRIDRIFPLWPMTESLLRHPRLPRVMRIYRALLKANLRAHHIYMERYHPEVNRWTAPVLQRVARQP